eukprot:6202180-Pleurochrysis_carterae.AAC.3
MCACMRASERACVRVSVRACKRACVRACVRACLPVPVFACAWLCVSVHLQSGARVRMSATCVVYVRVRVRVRAGSRSALSGRRACCWLPMTRRTYTAASRPSHSEFRQSFTVCSLCCDLLTSFA